MASSTATRALVGRRPASEMSWAKLDIDDIMNYMVGRNKRKIGDESCIIAP
jgi:hypothetical protein